MLCAANYKNSTAVGQAISKFSLNWRAIALLIAFLLVTGWSPRKTIAVANPSGGIAAGSGTIVTPVLSAPIPEGSNVIWCGTFDLAWQAARERLGFPIELVPHSPLAASLNRESFGRRSIDEGSIVVAAGTLRDGILAKIREATKKIGAPAPLLLDKPPGPGSGLICFASLYKQLTFSRPFGQLDPAAVEGTNVPCFGFLPGQGAQLAS